MDEIFIWLSEHFTLPNIMTVIEGLASGAIGLKLLSLYNKYKKYTVSTPQEIATDVQANLSGVIQTAVTSAVTAVVVPMVKKLQTLEGNNKIIAESLVLLSQGTPESRLALIQNISKINAVNAEIISEATASANEEIATEEAKAQATAELVKSLETPVKV